MDWHAWLSGARLEPALVYEYALVFARNELEAGDVAFLDHALLHSMGVSVAKHRLEILKLAWRDRRARRRSLSLSLSLARRLLGRVARCVRALVRRGDGGGSTALVLVPSQPPPDDGHSPGAGVVLAARQHRRGKALRRAKSEPKAAVGGRAAAAAVHAVGDVESPFSTVENGGHGNEMVRWDRLFKDLKPN